MSAATFWIAAFLPQALTLSFDPVFVGASQNLLRQMKQVWNQFQAGLPDGLFSEPKIPIWPI
jgi:hypothetical protein